MSLSTATSQHYFHHGCHGNTIYFFNLYYFFNRSMCLICWFTASLIGCIGHNYSLSGKPTLLPKHDKRHKSIEFVSIILTLYKKLNLKNLKNPDIDALTFYWITFLITHTSFILLESTLVSLYGKSTSLYTGGDVIWCHQILTLIFSFS